MSTFNFPHLPKYILIAAVMAFTFSCDQGKKEEKQGVVETQPVVEPPKSIDMEKASVYSTAHNSDLKLQLTDTIDFGKLIQPTEVDASITVDVQSSFQEILGIGAALTDASAETFYKLSEKNQKAFMEAYFDQENGIGYSLARTIIHSCDFSPYSYTYVDEGDKELKTFNIDHDREFRIPFTKLAIEKAGGSLVTYASPWSPPAFMKTNGNMLQGGSLKPEYRQAWANYYAKFIKAYEKGRNPHLGTYHSK